MPRPKKHINKELFEKLCEIQCTLSEICHVLDVSDKTLERFCKEQYGKTFAAVLEGKKSIGKIALRRMQWKHAERSPHMAIFLGKNYLGQRERFIAEITSSKELDPISKALKYLTGNTENK